MHAWVLQSGLKERGSSAMKSKTLVCGINAIILMMIIGHSLLLPDTTYGQVQGCVKNQQNEALPCVRISSADGSAVCSDSSGAVHT